MSDDLLVKCQKIYWLSDRSCKDGVDGAEKKSVFSYYIVPIRNAPCGYIQPVQGRQIRKDVKTERASNQKGRQIRN